MIPIARRLASRFRQQVIVQVTLRHFAMPEAMRLEIDAITVPAERLKRTLLALCCQRSAADSKRIPLLVEEHASPAYFDPRRRGSACADLVQIVPIAVTQEHDLARRIVATRQRPAELQVYL